MNHIFFLRNLFQLLILGWVLFYSGQNVSGLAVPLRNDSGSDVTSSASHRKSIDSPFVAVGAVITAHDFNIEMSKALRPYAPGSDRYHVAESGKKLFEEFGLHHTLSGNDINLISSSWDFLKKRLVSFASKVFRRYLKLRPDSRKMFPAFANINIAELATNDEFLSRACNCVSSLNYIIPHLKLNLPSQCPAFKNLKKKYNSIDMKILGSIWLNTMQEEMSNQIFNDDIRIVWNRVFLVLSNDALE